MENPNWTGYKEGQEKMVKYSPKISKGTVHPPKPPETSPGLKSERFQEFEGQSYPVLEFEVEIRTLARVEGCKLDFNLFLYKQQRCLS